jgi:hypothetical protein
LTDALGNPLKFILTPGQQSDIAQANQLIKNVLDAACLADKEYVSQQLIGCA